MLRRRPVHAATLSGSATIAAGDRLPELDGLRGIAASLVLLYHYTAPIEVQGRQGSVAFTVGWGGLGVQLFFMISGFVILMTANRARSALEFAIARGSRLFPAYWFTCVLALLAFTLTRWPPGVAHASTVIANWTMLQGFAGIPHLLDVFWTLHVELSFYGLIGILLLVRLHEHAVPIMSVAIVVWMLVTRLLHVNEFAFALTPPWLSGLRMAFPLLFHHLHPMPFFLLGVVLYRGRAAFTATDAIGAGVAIADISLHTVRYRPHHEWIILAAMVGAMVVATRRRTPVLRARPMVFVGTVSYSVYLVHTVIGHLTIAPLFARGWNANLAAATAATLSLVVASASTFWIERPANTWMRRRYASRRGPGSANGPDDRKGPV